MTHDGTVVNGMIVLDNGISLPEGTRVRVDLDVVGAGDDDDFDSPPWTETREEFLASMKQAIAEADAGLGVPYAVVLEELRVELGLHTNQ